MKFGNPGSLHNFFLLTSMQKTKQKRLRKNCLLLIRSDIIIGSHFIEVIFLSATDYDNNDVKIITKPLKSKTRF